MPSISLAVSGQTSEAYEVGPGARVTATGSGYVEWTSGTLTDVRNGAATWSTWPKGASTGYADTLRRVLIRGVATGALTVTWDEGERDEGPDDAYWQEQVPAWSLDSSGNVQGLVGPDGGEIDIAAVPADELEAPVQHVTLTAAMSTTVALTATATGTYRKARVAWNNNGASGTAKINIAVNASNSVHGLMTGQSALRRDHQMTMGDAVILVCESPITSLTFSADGSITGGTHNILVTFGN